MKRGSITYIFLFLSIGLFSQNISIFEKNEKFGLKIDNKVVIKASYDYMHPLRKNFYLIEKDKKIGVITQTGKVILPAIYDDVQNFADDYFLVTKDHQRGVVDVFNQTILPIEYSGFEQITDFLYEIVSNGKKGLFSKFGKIAMMPSCDEIVALSKDLLLIKEGGKMGIIDDMGNIIIPPNYNKIEQLPFENLYTISNGNKVGVINLSGKVIAEPIFDELDCSNKRYIILRKDNKYGFIINNEYIPAKYDKILFTQDDLGIIAVRQGNLNGFITIYGLVIPPIYDNISRFSPKGQAFVEKRGKLMFVDINGKERSLQEVTGRGSRPN